MNYYRYYLHYYIILQPIMDDFIYILLLPKIDRALPRNGTGEIDDSITKLLVDCISKWAYNRILFDPNLKPLKLSPT